MANDLADVGGTMDKLVGKLFDAGAPGWLPMLHASSPVHSVLDGTTLGKPGHTGSLYSKPRASSGGVASWQPRHSAVHQGIFCPTQHDAQQFATRLAAKLGDQESLDGAIGPMKIAIDSGFKEGKSIVWGVFQRDLDDGKIPDVEERESRRAAAAKELTNIDSEERDRRRTAGNVGAVLSAALYAGLLYKEASPITLSLAMFFPVALSWGFLDSARTGL